MAGVVGARWLTRVVIRETGREKDEEGLLNVGISEAGAGREAVIFESGDAGQDMWGDAVDVSDEDMWGAELECARASSKEKAAAGVLALLATTRGSADGSMLSRPCQLRLWLDRLITRFSNDFCLDQLDSCLSPYKLSVRIQRLPIRQREASLGSALP
jgi:hypothetical protein